MFLCDRALYYTLFYVLPDKLWKLVSTLETSRNSHGSFPVIIVKALFEGEVNQCLLGHFRCVVGHSEQSRSTCALCYILGSKVEIVRIICRHGLDHNASGVGVEKWWDKLMRVLSIFLPYGEISTIDLLIDCYDHYLWIVIFLTCLFSNLPGSVFQSWNFHLWQLHFNLRNA